MVIERRKFERYPCNGLGSCLDDANKPMGIKCHDLGAAGAGIASSEYLPKGTHLRISLCTKADKKPLLVKGVVRWCNKTPDEWQAGVQFNQLALFPLAMVL